MCPWALAFGLWSTIAWCLLNFQSQLFARWSRRRVIDFSVFLRYASCAIAPVGRCCSILLWHLLLLLPGSRLDLLRDALSLAGHLDAGLPGKPKTGVTPLQPRAHRGSTGRSRRIVIC